MELLSLTLIGWLFSVVSGIALVIGALIFGLQFSKEDGRQRLRKRLLEDLTLFAIWVLGLSGGIGVLLGQGWSHPVLEFHCWTLIVLLPMSCWSNLRTAPPPRNMRALSMALFVFPVLAVCIATILTLRSETAARVLAG